MLRRVTREEVHGKGVRNLGLAEDRQRGRIAEIGSKMSKDGATAANVEIGEPRANAPGSPIYLWNPSIQFDGMFLAAGLDLIRQFRLVGDTVLIRNVEDGLSRRLRLLTFRRPGFGGSADGDFHRAGRQIVNGVLAVVDGRGGEGLTFAVEKGDVAGGQRLAAIADRAAYGSLAAASATAEG